MLADPLSAVFDLIEVRTVISGSFAVEGPWVSRGPVEGLKLIGVMSGRADLRTGVLEGPVSLGPGDVVLIRDRTWLEMSGGGDGPRQEVVPGSHLDAQALVRPPGTDGVVGVGGRVDVDPAGRALLQESLPPMALVRGTSVEGHDLRASLHRLLAEVAQSRPGSEFAVRQHGQLVLLELVRAHLGRGDAAPGWLRLLTDDRLRPAIDLMHDEPGRAWRLLDLARASSMSRTSFAERFRQVAGMPPLTYLHRWRILRAQHALRIHDARVGQLADELGYSSESAFSTAFKREVGLSPLRYRQQVTAGVAAGTAGGAGRSRSSRADRLGVLGEW